MESCQEASTYAERNVLPFGGARSWSCSEGTLGKSSKTQLLLLSEAIISVCKRLGTSSFDLAFRVYTGTERISAYNRGS